MKKIALHFSLIILIVTQALSMNCWADSSKPIKVGGASPLTGYMASDGLEMTEGLKMAIKEINEAGGVLGRKLELVNFDTEELLSETFAAAAEKLIVKEKVDVIVSGYCGEAGPDVFGKYDVPFLYNEGSQGCLEIHKKNAEEYWNVFMTCDTSLTYGRLSFKALDALAKDANYTFPNKKMALIWGGWDWDEKFASSFAKAGKEKGWEVVMDIECGYETKEWSSILSKIKKEEPAIIFVGIWGSVPQATFLQQFKKDPMNSIIIHNHSTTNPEYLEMMGKQADGVLDETYKMTPFTPEGAAWKEHYQKMYKKKQSGHMPLITYDELMLWAAAVEKVGKVDDYRAVAKAIKESKYEGVAGTYIFNEYNIVPVTSEMPYAIYQYQNGKRVILTTVSDEGVDLIKGTKFQIPSWIK
ncbi:MAG: ABC transporter substrate-binding protein [Desulfobacterales bacterium]|nr:ABC transporter substrate-binding protein [Desulfobacterales bacterium]